MRKRLTIRAQVAIGLLCFGFTTLILVAETRPLSIKVRLGAAAVAFVWALIAARVLRRGRIFTE